MLELDAGIAVRKDPGEGFWTHQLPMIDAQDLEALRAFAPDMIESELDRLDRRPDILVVAIDHDQAARAVAEQLRDDVAQEPGERRGGDVDGAGKARPTARARLRAVAIDNGRRHQPAAVLGDFARDTDRDDGIAAQRHVPSMLLRGADRDEDRSALRDALFEFRPAQFRKKNPVRHRCSPWNSPFESDPLPTSSSNLPETWRVSRSLCALPASASGTIASIGMRRRPRAR